MTNHRPSLSQLYISSSYTSLASQATLTEDTTIPPSKNSEDDGEDPPSPPETSPFGDDDTDPTTPTVYNTNKINSSGQSVNELRRQAPLPTSSSTTSVSFNRGLNNGSNVDDTMYTNHTTFSANETTATATTTTIVPATDIFNKTVEKMTIPIRNNLPIAAAVETKVMGAHHHRHRSLVHHYSSMSYLPIQRPNNQKEEQIKQEDNDEKKPTAVFTTLPSNIPISPPAATAAATTATRNKRCSISSTAIGDEDAFELLQQQQQISKAKKERIIVLLGECLLKSGCPGHRAEEALQHSACILGLINATFSLLPETVLVTFTSDGGSKHQQSLMIKSPPSLDMGKIGEVQQIINHCLLQVTTATAANSSATSGNGGSEDNINHGNNNNTMINDNILDECIQALQYVSDSPPTWGFFGILFSFFTSSFTACAMLFNGSWMDCVLSGVLGLVVAMLFVLASYRPIYGRVFEISSCVLVSALAQALQSYCCFTSVAVSGVLILLPGYAMTMAVMELSARRITTGTIRLIYAVFYAFLLAYGFQIGSRAYNSISEALHGPMEEEHSDDLCGQNPISSWFYIPLLPLLSISIGISYGSSVRQWYAQLGGTIIGFCLCYFMNKIVPDPPIVESTAAFAVGLYSHFVLKLTGEPPLISMAVGITLLVPGSIGVKGAYALIHQQDTNQTLFPIKMLTVALGLAAGLFASAMIVYPAGKKRTLLLSF